MKITIEIPDTTMCVFANYIFVNDQGGISMGVKSIDSDDLTKARFAESQEERSNYERKID